MISPKEAQRIITRHAAWQPLCRVAPVSALGKVLAEDIYASSDSPDFDKSSMDGFAVSSGDTARAPGTLRIVDDIFAGQCPRQRLKKGECARIATGAMLPEGANSVVMKENTREQGDGGVEIFRTVSPHENVYRKATDCRKGDLLLKKGSVVAMAGVALLASQGKKSIFVFQAPRVAVLTTGDEIVEPGRKKKKEQIWNASASMLLAACRAMGIDTDYLGIARDDKAALSKKIKKGLTYDFLIITGAVSVGERDFIPEVLRRVGVSILFHKVAVRPGKPLLFGIRGKQLVFGLPGNPVSSMLGFILFVRPALQKAMGRAYSFCMGKGILAKDVYNRSARESYLPAQLKVKKGKFLVKPLAYSGSADLLSVVRADCFFILGPKQVRTLAGSAVKFLKVSG